MLIENNEKEELPTPLLKAHESLWERTGDDYLVEYFGKYYLMLDHVYYGDRVNEYGAETMADLFDIALYNAKTVSVQEALQDCLVLVSKSCKENGNMHFVSILVDAEASKEKVDQIKGVLQQHMFQKPEREHEQTLGERIESAAVRAAEGGNNNKTKEKESLISI